VMLNADAIARSRAGAGRSELESSLAAHMKAINAGLDPHEQLDALVVVTVKGTVRADVDVGMGYQFAVMIEDGTIGK
jgi:long-chain acyl-CoA synthetase